MYAFGSLVAAVLVLVFTRIDLATASNFHCGLQPHFSVGTANKDKADFYKSQLDIDVPDYGYTVLTYPGSNTITFGVNNVAVSFHANVVYETRGRNTMPSKPISQSFNDRISGIAQRIRLNYTVSSINDCHLYLLPIGIDRLTVSTKIARKIRQLAENCLSTAICQKIGKMNSLYRPGSTYQSGLAQLPGLVGPSMTFPGWLNTPPFENAFNRLVDSAATNLIGGLRATGRSRINVPKIHTHFKVKGILFKRTAHLLATNGTFSDLTTLARTSPATVSHEGMKFIVSSDFTINPAKLIYDYKMKHQFKTSKGKLTATINSVNLKAKFVADYTRIPCITSLDDLKVKSFGKIVYRFSNIGNLKSLINKKVWFDKKVLGDIGQAIEQQLINTTQNRQPGLWSFNCERFRP